LRQNYGRHFQADVLLLQHEVAGPLSTPPFNFGLVSSFGGDKVLLASQVLSW
jgi:hypothetical protein